MKSTMIGRVFRASPSARAFHHKGFALVVTLSLMILLTVIAVGLLTLSSVSLRSSTQSQAMAVAQANARLALMLAIGDLQKSAGADQRITAAADILPASKPAATGRSHWAGVWDTSAFSPATPDTKAFVRWLVSDAPSAPADATASAGTDDVLVFTGKDAASSVRVPKIKVGANSNSSYAYWVADEGLKADLGWSEGQFTIDERKQAARLTAAAGPDHGSFEGPFSGKPNYPITKTAGNPWLDNLDKALSAADMPLVMSDTSNQSTWLKSTAHDLTHGSRGILCDVKKGGLRRDLSLAFEMDGTADVTATSQPTKFNQQTGEFVGGNDRLAAPQAAQGMGGVKERFLYRDTQGGGTPFSNDIVNSESVVRGPNWWALRDYANLYKRLSGSGGSYSLTARSHYPNVSASGAPAYNLGTLTGTNSDGNAWDKETNNGYKQAAGINYIFRPARANYAPVILGSVCLFSAVATQSDGTTAKLGLGLDPLFYLWNPYNRSLKADKLAITADFAFPGHITFFVTQGGTRKQFGPSTTKQYLNAHATGKATSRPLTYLVSGLTMAPGEVIVVSPSSSRSASANAINDEASPGTNTDNASGVILSRIPVANAANTAISWQEVPLNLATDKVEFSYSNRHQVTNQVGDDVKGTNWFWLRTSLPPAGTVATDLATDAKYGDQIQAIDSNALGSIGKVPEHYYPGQNVVIPPLGPYGANTLANTKNFFGIVSYLAKPASFPGNYPNPVEVFAQFNPAPVGSTISDMWRPCHLNQIYNMVSRAGGANTLLTECAINFPATALKNGFWGASTSGGSTAVPMTDIPSAPLFSLVSFSHAALSVRTSEPYHALGNSWASLFASPVSPYGLVKGRPDSWDAATASDSSWLLNDALFDRYYLSGMAPEFTLTGGGYSATGSIPKTLAAFFGENYQDAQANPVLRPYLPQGKTAKDAEDDLSATDGYKKTGAYSLIEGVFNVNSTSVSAWAAFLRANRNLAIDYANGGTDGGSGSPFPSGTSPAAPGNGAAAPWSGFSRLDDSQVTTLAAEIVKQVKLRGPFMSLSDFVNHRVGTPKTAANYMGALQQAIEDANINSAVQAGAGGVAPVYSGAISEYLPDPVPSGSRKTSTGIPGDITQANLLLPLAPRLAARSDTFRIRGYGEARSKDGTQILAKATCEAVVQRFPEYIDPATDAANNEPWDEAAPTGTTLNPINRKFGRRFKLIKFRWLNPTEI